MAGKQQEFEVLRYERALVGWAVVISLVMHVVGVLLVERFQPTSEEVAQRVLFVTPTVGGKFVMRAPRVTKRLELRKIPREQGVRVERGQVPVVREEGVVTRTAVAQAEAVVERVVRGAGGVGGRGSRVVGVGELLERPGGWDQMGEVGVRMREVGVAKEPERRVDMSLEMLDVNSMDTGRYQAMVIQNPKDKQAIKGFFHLARVYPQSSTTTGAYGTLFQGFVTKTFGEITKIVNQYTGIKVDYIGNLDYDDERLLEVPWVMAVWSSQLTEHEVKNLARYLKAGGFLWGWLDGAIEGLTKYEGMMVGRDFYVDIVPENHPIFNSFFDLHQAPLQGGHNRPQGLWLNGRLCMISGANPGLGVIAPVYHQDTTRDFQMVVNTIVYALTQEGSITHQLMQTVK